MNHEHRAVLLREFLGFFQERKLKIFFDGTLGGCGHAQAILENHPEIELYVGCDVDPVALDLAEKYLKPWRGKVKLINGNFLRLGEYLDKLKVKCADGFFFDVGTSSMQLEDAKRGFSFRKNGPLDMRMDPTLKLTAAEIVNEFPEKQLGRIFKDYGEERRWRQAARRIVAERKKKRIKTTEDLVEVLGSTVKLKKRYLHPATLIFQALRIYVNNELEVLRRGIFRAIERLCLGGRIGVITFHSLEDRIVKWSFRENLKKLKILTKKPLACREEEIRKNPRSRSAKMRFAERVA